MRSLSPAAALEARAAGARIIDVRARAQHAQDGLEGSLCVPLDEIQAGQVPPELPRDAPLLLLCTYGHISELAALYLEGDGFTDVANVRGGLIAWRRTEAA